MAAPHLRFWADGVREVVAVVAVGAGFAGLFHAGRVLAELITIMECSGAIGGTRNPA